VHRYPHGSNAINVGGESAKEFSASLREWRQDGTRPASPQ